MDTQGTDIWTNPYPQQLLRGIVGLSDTQELPSFLRDVLTEKEILEISARFEAARLLRIGASYDTICAQTKLSTRTIARISQWLKEGTGGYDAALASLNSASQTDESHHTHMSPARAE